VSTVIIASPAKINLSLAIIGRRPDGFHDLISVVAPLAFGDELRAELTPAGVSEDEGTTLHCDQAGMPLDGTNLVLRAAEAFAAATGWRRAVRFTLIKRIPIGAGLGGGSSNAVAALRAMETLSGHRLSGDERLALAADLGSDCPLFLHEGPLVMRGRGEHIAPMPGTVAGRLRGRRVLVFKPAFGVATAWAFQALAARPEWYVSAAATEAALEAWMADAASTPDQLPANTLERPVFAKWPALPVMLAWLRERHGLTARMSGSGSACFAWLSNDADIPAITATIREGWGPAAFVQATEVA
jgi:4-diphosphocytidyl-2-C-methyl-D-erythritol kinase